MSPVNRYRLGQPVRLLLAVGLVLGATSLLSVAVAAEAPPDPITALKPLHLGTSLGRPDAPSACIVAGSEYQDAARALQDQIQAAADIRLPVISDTDALPDLAAHGNIVALGHYGNNKVIEHFYFRGYLVVDALHPGEGGYLLQTIHNPDALGINLIVAGGSDTAGIGKAADRLIERLAEHGARLPRLFDVELGDGREIVAQRAEKILAPNRVWPTNQMNRQESLHEAAMLYVHTGDAACAALFKAKLVEWLTAPPSERDNALDDFWRVVLSWDMLEEAPAFTDGERLQITRLLWDELNLLRPKTESYVFSRKDKIQPRKNHGARSALSVYVAARYFWQYYRIPEMKQWLDDVATYWQPQMTSWMPMEGTAQGIATLMPATCYALAENERSFLSREVLGRIADKVLMQHRDSWIYGGEYGMIWLALAAHLFDEPRYLTPIVRKCGSIANALRFPDSSVREFGRSFWDGTPAADPAAGAGLDNWVAAMPLSRLYHDNVSVFGERNVSYDKAFDFLVFGDPLGQDRQYLEVGGNNAGSYSTDSGNAITVLNLKCGWIGGGPWVLKTRRHLSSVAIVRDGRSEPLPAFVRLDRAECTRDWGIARSGYLNDTGTDWFRNIINVPDKWVLVVDEIAAREPGEYVLESRWALATCSAFDGNDLVSCQYGPGRKGVALLRITGVGWQNQYVTPRLYRDFLESAPSPFPRTMKDLSRTTGYQLLLARHWAGSMKPSDMHVFANLLYEQSQAKEPFYRLRELRKDSYLVSTATEAWTVRRDNDGQWLVEETDPVPPADTGDAAEPAPPAPIDLRPAWQHTETARILSCAAASSGHGVFYAVGLADGRIRVRNEQGEVTADATMPGRVYALCALDLDGDGSDEVVAGGDTGGVHAFDVKGRPLWSWTPPPWKRPSHARQGSHSYRTVITGVTPADVDGDGAPEILAMGICWYVLDRDGNMIFIHETSHSGVSWDGLTPEFTLLVTAGDVAGDSAQEIVGDLYGAGDAGGSRLVHVWNTTSSEPVWLHSRPPNRFAGSALKAVIAADTDGDGKDEFVIASDAYNLHLGYYDYGPENRGVWYANVGSGANALIAADLNADGGSEIIVGTEMGQVQALDAGQNRLFVADVEQSVMALAARPQGNRHEIWAGTVNGSLFVINAAGERVRRGHLPGCLDHLAVTQSGSVLATTSGGSVALYGAGRNVPAQNTAPAAGGAQP